MVINYRKLKSNTLDSYIALLGRKGLGLAPVYLAPRGYAWLDQGETVRASHLLYDARGRSMLRRFKRGFQYFMFPVCDSVVGSVITNPVKPRDSGIGFIRRIR
jgi:hypothetical protein